MDDSPRPDDNALVSHRLDAWRDTYNPASPDAEFLYTQLVVASVRIDRCQAEQAILGDYQARRAQLSWLEDRAFAAETLGATLARKPPLVSRRLRRSLQGCNWLIDRWTALSRILDAGDEWTQAQRSLAYDLLGTPPEFRDEGPPTLDGSPAPLVARELARLEQLKTDSLEELDAYERAAALAGLEVEPSPALNRLKRYEAACLRLFQWARKQLTSKRPAPAHAPEPEHFPAPAPARRAPTLTPFQPALPDPEYKDYEANLLREYLACIQPIEDEPTPEPSPAHKPSFSPAPAPAPARPLHQPNRRARRAANRRAHA